MPLALAVQACGHDVRLATGADLVSWANECGVDARAVGRTQADATRLANEQYAWPEAGERLFTDIWVGAAMPDLLALCRSWRPDLVVHEEEEYAGVLLAAILDVPCVTHSWSSPARPLAGRQTALRLMTPIWDRHLPGVTPRTAGHLYLDACPPPMQSDDIAGIDNVVTVRASTFDGPRHIPPGWQPELPRPAAYFTLGTVPLFSTPERLAHVAHAIAPRCASVVMTTGPNLVQSLPPLPPNVRAFQYLPQSLVLEHVDLVVSQGGAGGTVGALMHALPHLVIAQQAQSQITVSRAVETLGVGVSLDPDHRGEEDIREAVDALLRDPGCASRASRVRAELMKLPGPQEVARLLEERFA